MKIEPEQLSEEILGLAENEQWDALAHRLADLHPADIAALITPLPSETRERVFGVIGEELKADVLAELEGTASEDVLDSLTDAEISHLMDDMAPDDAADVLAELSAERSEGVLSLMEEEDSEGIRQLLQFDQETAGGIMNTDVFYLRDRMTIEEAISQFAYVERDDPVHYLYVVDEENRLVGWLGLWEILKLRDRSQRLGDLAHTEIVAVTTDKDQEEVAQVMSRYDLSTLPVVDQDQRLVGRITFDDVMDVLEEEASEDIFRLAGSDDAELEHASPFRASRLRLPWLLITMVITFFSSLILKRFMLDLTEVLALSFFVPIVMAVCGSTGMQSSTLIIRRISLGTMDAEGVPGVLGREVVTGLMMGIVCGILLGFWAQFIIHITPDKSPTFSPLHLAMTASAALFTAMIFAAAFGAAIPLMLRKAHIDPAVASGPFVTASNDIFSLLIYYGVTLLFIGLGS